MEAPSAGDRYEPSEPLDRAAAHAAHVVEIVHRGEWSVGLARLDDSRRQHGPDAGKLRQLGDVRAIEVDARGARRLSR